MIRTHCWFGASGTNATNCRKIAHPSTKRQQHEANQHRRDRETLDLISGQLGITKLDDWYGITKNDLAKCNGQLLLGVETIRLPRLLTVAYPENEWCPWKFKQSITNGYWNYK